MWNFRCARGRRCADVTTDAISVSGGPVLHIEYVCDVCKTIYHWDTLNRKRERK